MTLQSPIWFKKNLNMFFEITFQRVFLSKSARHAKGQT